MPTYWEPWPGKTQASLAFSATLILGRGRLPGRLAGEFRFDALPDSRRSRLALRAVALNEELHDAAIDVVRHRFFGDADRVFDLRRPRATVCDDRDAAQTEQRRAAVFPVVQATIGAHERAAAHEITHAAQRRLSEGALQHAADIRGETFHRLQRDIAGKAVAHDDVDLAVEEVATFDVADVVERGLREQIARRAREVVALGIFFAVAQ